MRVPRRGALRETGEPWQPFRLLDPTGESIEPASVFFRDLMAAGRSEATVRSYGMDLLRWFRFLWAVEVPWDRATRIEARDFSCWIQGALKPARGSGNDTPAPRVRSGSGGVNPVTGKPLLGPGYAVSTVRHSETVLRSFYEMHREEGTGPVINPFPLRQSRRGGRPNAHHNPMRPFRNEPAGRYRPRAVTRLPRSIPDRLFDELFARLRSDRDRALVALWVSSGVRAAELLGLRQGDVDPGQQLITVVRKGSRAVQQVPASPDAFVWLRLYQQSLPAAVPVRRGAPLWWTLRRPFKPLTYHAAHRMFERTNTLLGANWTLHALRHTAAQRMVADTALPLTDVQWVLGHARPESMQPYLTPTREQAVERALEHYARRARPQPPAPPAPGYNPASLEVLLGRRP